MRTLIVDDEPLVIERVRTLLSQHADFEIIGEGRDGSDAVDLVGELRPELMFLDIRMPELDGFEVIEAIPIDIRPMVVFITAYDEHAVQAFDANAIDYILKPIDPERFAACLVRVRDRRAAQDKHDHAEQDRAALKANVVVFHESGRRVIINPADVRWMEASKNHVLIHTRNGRLQIRTTFDTALSRMPDGDMLRVHRSFAVRADSILEIRTEAHANCAVILNDGIEIPVSRSYRAAIDEWMDSK